MKKRTRVWIDPNNVDRENGLFKGIVYIYINTTPGPQYGWVYIGITTNEHERRIRWFNLKNKYSGRKINAARLLYGINNFRYDVLEIVLCATVNELITKLEALERMYIAQYDSTRKGYNINGGGVGKPAVRVIVEDALGNITIYESMVEAGLAIGLKEGSIRYWIHRQRPTKHGYTIKAA